MAGNRWWKPDKHGEEHLEDSSLLAFIRRQQLENQSKIKQHLEIERCPRCLHRCSELEQISKTLAVLGRMPPYQHYPEQSVMQTYNYMLQAMQQRDALAIRVWEHMLVVGKHSVRAIVGFGRNLRPKRPVYAVRLASIVALFLVFTVLMFEIAQALRSSKIGLPFSSSGIVVSSKSPNATGLVQQNSTPTPNATRPVTLTATANANAIASQPYIQVCSTSTDIAKSHLVICGYNFDAGHKVSLIVIISGRGPVMRHPVLVDKQGEFQDSWYVHNCRNLPIAIFAYEVDNVKVSSPTLGSISFADCPASTPGG